MGVCTKDNHLTYVFQDLGTWARHNKLMYRKKTKGVPNKTPSLRSPETHRRGGNNHPTSPYDLVLHRKDILFSDELSKSML